MGRRENLRSQSLSNVQVRRPVLCQRQIQLCANADYELHNSFTIHSFILADQGSDSQTTGSTLKGHLLAHLAPAPTNYIFLYFFFVHFGLSCPIFLLSVSPNFTTFPMPFLILVMNILNLTSATWCGSLAGWQAPVIWPSSSPAPRGGIAQGFQYTKDYFQPNSGSPKSFNHFCSYFIKKRDPPTAQWKQEIVLI